MMLTLRLRTGLCISDPSEADVLEENHGRRKKQGDPFATCSSNSIIRPDQSLSDVMDATSDKRDKRGLRGKKKIALCDMNEFALVRRGERSEIFPDVEDKQTEETEGRVGRREINSFPLTLAQT